MEKFRNFNKKLPLGFYKKVSTTSTTSEEVFVFHFDPSVPPPPIRDALALPTPLREECRQSGPTAIKLTGAVQCGLEVPLDLRQNTAVQEPQDGILDFSVRRANPPNTSSVIHDCAGPSRPFSLASPPPQRRVVVVPAKETPSVSHGSTKDMHNNISSVINLGAGPSRPFSLAAPPPPKRVVDVSAKETPSVSHGSTKDMHNNMSSVVNLGAGPSRPFSLASPPPPKRVVVVSADEKETASVLSIGSSSPSEDEDSDDAARAVVTLKVRDFLDEPTTQKSVFGMNRMLILAYFRCLEPEPRFVRERCLRKLEGPSQDMENDLREILITLPVPVAQKLQGFLVEAKNFLEQS